MKIPLRKKQLVKLDNSGSSVREMATTIAPITITIPNNNLYTNTDIADKYDSDEMELKNFSDELQKALDDANNGLMINKLPTPTTTNAYEFESSTFENLAKTDLISTTTNQPELLASLETETIKIFENITKTPAQRNLPIITTTAPTISDGLPINNNIKAISEHDLRQNEQLLDAIDHLKSIEDETNTADEESIESEYPSQRNSHDSFEIIDSQLLSKEKSTMPIEQELFASSQKSNMEQQPQSLSTPSTSPIDSSLASLSTEMGTTKMIIRKNGNRTVRKVVFIRNPISSIATAAAAVKKTYRKRAVGDENHIHTGPITPSPLLPIAPPPSAIAHSPNGILPFRGIGRRFKEESSVERIERRKQNLENLMQFVTMCGHVDRYVNTRLRSSVKKLGKLFDTEEEETQRRRRRRYSFI